MRILAFETTTHRCGVALLEDGNPVVALDVDRPRIHAAHLIPFVAQVLDAAAWQRSDLDVIAVSMGPGSYTGLRIGVSAAKGLAQALGCRIVGVSTLEALAAQVVPFAAVGDYVVSNLFARRGEVYAATYRVDSDRQLDPTASPAAHTTDVFIESLSRLNGPVWVAGPGSLHRLKALVPPEQQDIRLIDIQPAALTVGQLGYWKAQHDSFEDVVSFEPTYIKDFVARRPQRSAFDKLPF